MLSMAISDIERATREAEAERLRRAAGREALRRAEAYLATIEDLVEDDLAAVPEPLLAEVVGFVRGHSRRLARSLSAAGGGAPTAVLDALFEVEERIQRQRAELLQAA